MRLIDADALLEREVYYDRLECLVLRYEIEREPTIDAVPVVRCKDCIFKSSWYKHDSLGFDICRASGMFIVEDIDFCSYGERRKDATD